MVSIWGNIFDHDFLGSFHRLLILQENGLQLCMSFIRGVVGSFSLDLIVILIVCFDTDLVRINSFFHEILVLSTLLWLLLDLNDASFRALVILFGIGPL